MPFHISLQEEKIMRPVLFCKKILAILSLRHLSDSLLTKCPEVDPCFPMWGFCDGTLLHQFPTEGRNVSFPEISNSVTSRHRELKSKILRVHGYKHYQRKTRHTLYNLEMGSLRWTFPIKHKCTGKNILQEEILISSYLWALRVTVMTVTAEKQVLLLWL